MRVAWRFARCGVLRLQVAVLIEQPGVHDVPYHGTGDATSRLAVFDHDRDDNLRMLGRGETDEQRIVTVALQGFTRL